MEIEEVLERVIYRDFDLVHLRRGKTEGTRWHISHYECGIDRNYGFVDSERDAMLRVDHLLSNFVQEFGARHQIS